MVKRVTQQRAMHSTTACPIPSSLGPVVYPFLAPALREALQTTDYAQVTRVVPGEADDWCASHAQDNPRSIIFSGDTDLIVYDYPPEVLVNFFKDVDILTEQSLKVYSPHAICQQLNLKSLVHLAYAIHNDRWKSLASNAIDARNHDLESSLYLAFSRRYIGKVQPPTENHATLEASLQALDARVSEFVVEAIAIDSSKIEAPPLALPVFLPLLMEDPFQASAWNNGKDLRLLAYSLFTPGRVVIQEHIRKAQGVSVQEISIPTQDQAAIISAELMQTLQTSPADNHLSPARYWMLFSIQLALNSLKPPHISLVTRVAAGEFDNTWAFVHLQACIQATLYSLRMLKQCIAVWLALHSRDSAPNKSLVDTISRLDRALQSMPTIAELFTVPGQKFKSSPDDGSLADALKAIYVAARIEDKELFEEPKSKRQKKRDKRDKKRSTQVPKAVPEKSSWNVFDILGSRSSSGS